MSNSLFIRNLWRNREEVACQVGRRSCFLPVSGPAQGPIQLPSRLVLGDLPLGVKQPGCEVNHSNLYNAKVKNEWSYTSTPHVSL
jgi:hypothetical protein